MFMEFCIEGNPLAKKRPRFSRRGRKVMTYDEQMDEKTLLRYRMISQMNKKGYSNRFKGALHVQMVFYTAIPDSWSKKRKETALGRPDVRKPDLDNYIKMYADVMNRLIYEDDNQIAQLWCRKVHSERPRVEICICDYIQEEKYDVI